MNVQVGTVVELTRDCLGNSVGTVGVCYEVYNIGHTGYSFIFENGNYDGFDEQDMEMFLTITGFCKELSNYQFTNVMKLCNDFSLGVFDTALKNTT